MEEKNNDNAEVKEDSTAVKSDEMEVKEVKADDIKKDDIKSNDAKEEPMKVKRSTLWMIATVILAVLFVISIFTHGFRGGVTGGVVVEEGNENSFIFMNSDVCTAACDEMEPVAKEIALKTGLRFSKAKYSQPVPIPGYVLIKDGKLTIAGINDKGSFIQEMCTATNNEEICKQAEKAKEEALKGKCENFAKEKTPRFKMFVMSFCPYGQKAMELVEPAVKDLGSTINFEPHYVVYDKSTYAGREDSFCAQDVCSMHGIPELHEDMRQKCVWKYDKENYWSYLNCINSNCNSRDVDECWKKCSDKLTDADKIEKCQKEEGVELMRLEKEEMAKFGVSGSESLILNSERLEMRDYRWDPNKLKNLICCGFEDKPEICKTTIKGASESSGPAAGSCG